MTADLSFVHLIAQSSVVVKAVLIILLLASLASWTVILRKRGVLKRTRAAADWFEEHFQTGGSPNGVYRAINRKGSASWGLESLFMAGFKEFHRKRPYGRGQPEDVVDAAQRSMDVALRREVDRVEEGLSLLATVASSSVYVGLFGTVWGIMAAFIGLGNVQQATLQQVAPGIAEALIATAMGLFAAIPAMIAFNTYTNQIDRLENRYQSFIEELTGILQRDQLRAGERRSQRPPTDEAPFAEEDEFA
jgi:biopolymer transport protein TolQ